ncbi:hypothetical protein CBS101457_001537 [Exobasidium rhododendri]|nr:hypothetical protein CBS101457_001537 [Exobasidium rhododendri]
MTPDTPSYPAWDRFFARYSGGMTTSARTAAATRYPRRVKSTKELSTLAATAKKPSARSEAEWEECTRRLRRLVLIEGIPADEYSVPVIGSPARPLVWKMLLNVRTLSPSMYLSLLAKGPSPMHDKIQNDASRTLATDRAFKTLVNEATLVRVLDAFVWKYWTGEQDGDLNPKSDDEEISFSYVQGMNVLLAPFLYVMPSELEVFHCFCQFIEHSCPTYVQPSLSGVHKGLELLDRCLQMADPALFDHLKSKGLTAELYGFASVLTLCAGTPTLPQVLQLWDYLLSFGPHLSILCILAQLLLIRDELMASPHPMRLLRQFPDLNAKSVIGVATTLVRDLDDTLYDDLVHHMVEL